jgi:hypothetical protein
MEGGRKMANDISRPGDVGIPPQAPGVAGPDSAGEAQKAGTEELFQSLFVDPGTKHKDDSDTTPGPPKLPGPGDDYDLGGGVNLLNDFTEIAIVFQRSLKSMRTAERQEAWYAQQAQVNQELAAAGKQEQAANEMMSGALIGLGTSIAGFVINTVMDVVSVVATVAEAVGEIAKMAETVPKIAEKVMQEAVAEVVEEVGGEVTKEMTQKISKNLSKEVQTAVEETYQQTIKKLGTKVPKQMAAKIARQAAKKTALRMIKKEISTNFEVKEVDPSMDELFSEGTDLELGEDEETRVVEKKKVVEVKEEDDRVEVFEEEEIEGMIKENSSGAIKESDLESKAVKWKAFKMKSSERLRKMLASGALSKALPIGDLTKASGDFSGKLQDASAARTKAEGESLKAGADKEGASAKWDEGLYNEFNDTIKTIQNKLDEMMQAQQKAKEAAVREA